MQSLNIATFNLFAPSPWWSHRNFHWDTAYVAMFSAKPLKEISWNGKCCGCLQQIQNRLKLSSFSIAKTFVSWFAQDENGLPHSKDGPFEWIGYIPKRNCILREYYLTCMLRYVFMRSNAIDTHINAFISEF